MARHHLAGGRVVAPVENPAVAVADLRDHIGQHALTSVGEGSIGAGELKQAYL